MKATFPAREFPWAAYTCTVLTLIVAAVATILVYNSLPERLATTWDFKNIPVGYMQKEMYVSLVLSYMFTMAVFCVVFDRLYLYAVFPVPLLSAISGALGLFCLIIHLLLINVLRLPELNISETIIVLCLIPCVYVVLHMIIFRSGSDEIPREAPLWFDTPPHSWLTVFFFFVRPILPHQIIAYNSGLVLRSKIYCFRIPWEQIRSLEHATIGESLGGRTIRISSSPSRSVKLKLVDHKYPIIFSINNENRLFDEWEKHKKTAGT